MPLYNVIAFHELSESICQVFLAPVSTDVILFQAGQYVEVRYPDGNFLPFSVANSPHRDHIIELHIKHLEGDIATRDFVEHLRAEKPVEIRGPFGQSFYKKEPELPVLLLAGGTGFSYAKAIIEAAISADDPRAFHLYWGVKTERDFYRTELFNDWQQLLNLKTSLIISKPVQSPNWQGKTGYIHNAVINDHPSLIKFQAYASGPFEMVKKTFEQCKKYGMQEKHFYSDML